MNYIFTFLILVIILSIGIIPNKYEVFAAEAPVYDPTFNNGLGAFFANGTSITIMDVSGTTTVSYVNNNVQIKPTTLIFGGGKEGTNFGTAKIFMNSGTVGSIFGGGYSKEQSNPAKVGNAEIVINDGTVTGSIFGGGLLYSQVESTTINMNNGTATFVVGGGMAHYKVDGITYDTGTKEEPQNSGTIVKSANIIINNGTVEDVYGGGQGYSNTEATSVEINNGKFSYLTAGGANGYTGNANVKINGGDIGIYLSTNRGTVDKVDLQMTNGTVKDFYVGGENAYDVTGTINNVNCNMTGGKITNLYAGLNGGEPLEVEAPNYIVKYVDGVVENDFIKNNTGNAWIIVLCAGIILIIFIVLFVVTLS